MGRCGCASECLCSVTGSNCISVVGSGSVVSPYTVAPIISAAEGNGLTCEADGLFAGGGLAAYGLMLAVEISTVLPATGAAGVPSRAYQGLDFVQAALNVGADPTGFGSLYPDRAYFTIQPGYAGIYAIVVSAAGWTAGPAAAGDVIFRAGIGLADGSGVGAVGMSGVPVYTSAAEPYNAPAITFTAISPLVAGNIVWPEVAVEDYTGAFAGATLDYGPTYDNIPTAGFSFSITRIADTPV